MIRITEINSKTEYKKIWRKLQVHILQSWEWGQVKSNNWKPIRLGASSKGGFVGIWTILIRRLPLGVRIGYLPRSDFNEDAKIRALLEYIRKFALCDLLLIEPNATKKVVGDIVRSLKSYPINIQPDYTNTILLTVSKDELWDSLKGKYRRNIKKGWRHGVEVECLGYDDKSAVEKFYTIMESIFATTDYVMHKQGYFQRIWDIMAPEKLARICIAKLDNEVVGAYFLLNDNLSVYELYGGVNSKGRDVEAGYVLKWEVIKMAKDIGAIVYDHWGTAPIDDKGSYVANHPLHNISNFKAGFGGQNIAFCPPKMLIFSPIKGRIILIMQYLQRLRIHLRKYFL